MSNLPSGMLVLNPETKEYMLALPTSTTTPFPMIDHEKDTGAFVKAILLNREKLLGKQILGAANYWTPEQIVEEFKNAQPEVAKGAKAVEISPKMFTDGMAKTGAPEAIQDEMLENVQFIGDFGYYGGLSLDESLAVRISNLFLRFQAYTKIHLLCSHLVETRADIQITDCH